MSNQNNKIVTGLFRNRKDVEAGYKAAIDRGYKPEEINVIMTDDTRKKYFNGKDVETELGNKSVEGLGVGGAVGGTIGAIVAAIAAIGTAVVIPGLGVVIAGPIAAGLVGAGAGSITGGLVGALIGLGIPEERVKIYEKEIKSGGILMGVHSRSDEDSKFIESEWDRYHSENTKH